MFIFTILFFKFSCQGMNQKQGEIITTVMNQDSVKIVAMYFLTFDDFINSYTVSDKDVDEVFQEHKDWVIKYFPTILNEYDMTLYSKFTLASYLYKEHKQDYLIVLWKKYKKFSGSNEKGIAKDEEFKSILNLISEFGIKFSDLDKK
jgi:hypothetical protein